MRAVRRRAARTLFDGQSAKGSPTIRPAQASNRFAGDGREQCVCLAGNANLEELASGRRANDHVGERFLDSRKEAPEDRMRASTDLIRGSAACYSSATRGRAIVQIRDNHLVTDDPAEPSSYYHGPGEAPGSLELFLGGIVSCAVLMLERIARSEGRTLGPIRAEMDATRDPTAKTQPPVLDTAKLTFIFHGLTNEEAGQLVETFKGR